MPPDLEKASFDEQRAEYGADSNRARCAYQEDLPEPQRRLHQPSTRYACATEDKELNLLVLHVDSCRLNT